jgi:hypothetical protein
VPAFFMPALGPTARMIWCNRCKAAAWYTRSPAHGSVLPMSPLPAYAELLERRAHDCTLRYLATDNVAAEPSLSAQLVEVGERRERAGYEQFSLLFSAEKGPGHRQGTYAVEFADGQRWEVFLVPVGGKDGKTDYEACFNRSAVV